MQRGNRWVRWFWLALVAYMMYTVGRLAYKNYQLNVQEMKLRGDVATLQVDIQNLKNQIVYFQSDSYKEKMLREKLNLQKPGEKVVVLPAEPKLVDGSTGQQKTTGSSNPEQWWDFLIGI